MSYFSTKDGHEFGLQGEKRNETGAPSRHVGWRRFWHWHQAKHMETEHESPTMPELTRKCINRCILLFLQWLRRRKIEEGVRRDQLRGQSVENWKMGNSLAVASIFVHAPVVANVSVIVTAGFKPIPNSLLRKERLLGITRIENETVPIATSACVRVATAASVTVLVDVHKETKPP